MWAQMLDRDVHVDKKLVTLGVHAVSIVGCTKPCEKTSSNITSIPLATSGVKFTPAEAKEKTEKFKKIVKGLREKTKAVATMSTFPESAEDFMVMYPNRSIMPCRKSAASLKDLGAVVPYSGAPQAPQAQHAQPPQMHGPIGISEILMTARVMTQFMTSSSSGSGDMPDLRFLFGRGGDANPDRVNTGRGPTVEDVSDSVAAKRTTFEILPGGAVVPAGGESGNGGLSTLSEVQQKVHAALARKAKAAAKKKGKSKAKAMGKGNKKRKHSDADDDSENDSCDQSDAEEDEEDEDDKADDAPAAKRRSPSALLKRPAAHGSSAATKKRPAVATATVKDCNGTVKKLKGLYPELFDAKGTTAPTVGAFTSRAYDNIRKKHGTAAGRTAYAIAKEAWDKVYD